MKHNFDVLGYCRNCNKHALKLLNIEDKECKGKDLQMKIKQEVKDLCLKLRECENGSDEWNDVIEILKNKYRFSAYAILAMFYNPPIIEHDENNYHLVMEEE